MRARITDPATLRTISPAQIIAYIRSRGAVQVGNFLGKATIWSYKTSEFLVPVDIQFADYAYRIAEILAALEKVEDRSQVQIFEDLQNSGFDIIRIRDVSEDTRTGSLSFMRSVDFIAHTRDLLMAAACSAATHKISYLGRKPQDAERFMESVRFAQTERGSFVLCLLAPVAPGLTSSGATTDMPEEVPYEKRVVPTLQQGLEALSLAAQRSSLDNSMEHFQEAAVQGVTTNMCDALIALHEDLRPNYIEIGITYSVNRSETPNFTHIVDAGYIPLIKVASESIKAKESEPGQVVRGPVVWLESQDPETWGGTIKIRDIMAPRPRLIQVQLSSEEYLQALAAHRDGQIVELTGTVVKAARSQTLVAPSPLVIIGGDVS